jgi:hypothetical protein
MIKFISKTASLSLLVVALIGCAPFVYKTVDIPSMLDRYVGRKLVELPGDERFSAKPFDVEKEMYVYQDKRCHVAVMVDKKTGVIESWHHISKAESCKPYYVFGGQPW